MDVDEAIGEHYGRVGLEESILSALIALGRDPDHTTQADLAPVDELHTGGAESARELARDAGIGVGSRVLDVGSGLGGPARLFASEFGAIVDGIDVTPRFVSTATSLTRRSGLSHAVSFTLGSALDLPFADAEFDAATMIHVGMNIQDKATLFRSVARVLKPGSRFAIFDFMVVSDGPVHYPLPWSDSIDTSFLVAPDSYLSMLEDAGFTIDKQENWMRFAFESPLEVTAPEERNRTVSPLGLHIVLGSNLHERMRNVMAAMTQGVLQPIEIVSHIG